ncbi:MAG TPA: cytochrome c [Thermohalobaculum sp.]|nr:cytochrome c [Thermohalobaculum sp.]
MGWAPLLAAALAPVAAAPAGEAVVPYTIVDGRAIPASLTGAPGDAERGRALYAGDPRTGCPACHGTPGMRRDGPQAAPPAPDLAGIGGRLDAGEIRLWLVAPEVLAESTSMPAYYAAGQRTDAGDPLYGGPRLTAAEIEDLVAYLAGLGAPE